MTATFLFVLNNYNDVDQTAPLLYQLLEERHRVIVTSIGQYILNTDIRINDLHTFPNFSVVNFYLLTTLNRKPSLFRKVCRELLFNIFFAVFILLIWRVDLCLFTWCNPYRKGFQTNLFRAAKLLKVPNICLPHGHNIFTNMAVNQHLKDFFREHRAWPDFSFRNYFDLYVVQTEHHRQRNIEWGMNPKTIVSWGSMRFHPNWIKHHQALCPTYAGLSAVSKTCLNIVFFIPHWHYNVDNEKTIELLVELSKKNEVLLAVKGHSRGDEVDPIAYQQLSRYKNVDLNASAPSTALISWADIVINFGSSIGLEALVIGKPVINPMFLHGNNTVFDASGAVLDTHTIQDVTRLIDRAITNNLPSCDTASKETLLKTEVFGGNKVLDTTAFYVDSLVTFCLVHKIK